jgi:hypothetical protein
VKRVIRPSRVNCGACVSLVVGRSKGDATPASSVRRN